MKHWMMWAAGMSVALGVATADQAIAAEKAASSKPAASKQAGAPANPTEDWAVTAVAKEAGGFDYCAAGTRFDNGHGLLIARNKADEIIVIVGLPSDKLKTKSLLPTKLVIDGREKRQGSGLVTRPSAMAVTMGKDQGFFDAIRRGNVLSIENAEVKLSVILRGSGKAMTDLSTCIQTEGKSVAMIEAAAVSTAPTALMAVAPDLAAAATPEPEPTLAPIAAQAPVQVPGDTGTSLPPSPAPTQVAALPHPTDPLPAAAAAPVAPAAAKATPAAPLMGPALPDPLVNLLSAAGMAGVVPVSLDRVPLDQRPATFAWKYGPVFGGIREISIIDNRSLTDLTDSYVEVLKNSCSGKFSSSLGSVETLREITLRTGEATCVLPERTTEFRHLYYINKSRIFTTFIHESDSDGKAMAVKARDQLAGVIRQLAMTGSTAR